MAAAGLENTFKTFASKEDGKEATSKDIARWCTDAGVFKDSKTCNVKNLDTAFSAVKPKGKSTITAKEVAQLIENISQQYASDHKMEKDAAKEKLIEMLAKTSAKKETAKKEHGSPKESKPKKSDSSGKSKDSKSKGDSNGKSKSGKKNK